jgi:DNA polymerase I-like protein with 3'-5' exonuclease and polymerase domains
MAIIKPKHDPNKGGALQMSMFTPECDWKPPNIVDLPSWAGAKRIALDAETKDPSIGNKLGTGQLRDGHTVGWAFAIDGGPKHYLPFRHEGGDNLPIEGVLGYLREQIKHFDGEIVGANLAYDVDYGYNDGFVYHPEVKFRDIQIADPLLYELHFSYSLDNIGKRNGIVAKDEAVLREAAAAYGLDGKKGLWRLPARYVGVYAEQDVTSPLEILAIQEKEIDKRGLRRIWDLETAVLPALVRMRRRGVRIDFDKLSQIEAWCLKDEQTSIDLIKRETGIDIGMGNVWKPKVIAPALEEIGMRLNKTSTGAPQIDKALLSAAGNPVAAAILRTRKVNKIRTTFADSIRRYSVKGRIHCQFNQIAREDESGDQKGVRYGRLSAVHPNLQQQPTRFNPAEDPEIIGEWRKIFIPEEEAIWGCNDYAQQEPKWTTHMAAVIDLPKAREAAKRYRDDPNTDNHEMMVRLIKGDAWTDNAKINDPKAFKVERSYDKNIFLGVCYGEGGPKLCQDIGMPTRWAHIAGWGKKRKVEFFEKRHDAMAMKMDTGTGYIREMAGEEGQEILDKFDAEVPFVRKLAKAASERAESNGLVKTIAGRQLHFEQRDDGSYNYTHKALNRIIQGSAADQTKQAVVEIDRQGYFMQLQVHDETDGSFGSVAEAKEVGEIMANSIKSKWLPFTVDTETGPNWGEIK